MASTLKIDTVTTPDGTGNITFSRPIVGDGSNLTNLPGGGKILQCLQTIKTDVWSMGTVGTWTDITGLSQAITPASTSNKILIIAHLNVGVGSSGEGHVRINGGNATTYVGDTNSNATRCASSRGQDGNSSTLEAMTLVYLDSPNTTSATTYQIQMMNPTNNNGYLNRSDQAVNASEDGVTASSILVQEIGA